LKQHAGRLKQALTDSHQLAGILDESGFPLAELEVLQSWQRQRLAETYADLIYQKRYRAAGEFFLNELYGGLHFRERDQEMERVLPAMVRMLRDDMLLVLAEAFELQSLSLQFDMDMTRLLREAGWRKLDPERYRELYRSCGRAADRKRQIDLIRHLGLQLNELVHHRLVLMLIRMLRGPARAAGFGKLQGFLEEGLQAFREMGDGTDFILTIWHREAIIMSRLLEGDGDPFRAIAA
jgi:hypothetical protein